MHRNLNISSEDGTRRQKYERMAQMNQPAQKTEYDKENTHYTYSPTTVSPKKTLDFDTQANSPRFTHNQDSFEESANVSHTNYTEQYHSKRLSELRETSSNRRNILQNGSYGGNNDTFEKSRNYTENDVKLLKQEAIALRRSLGEAQAKTSIMSKEFSKLQHENSMYQSQLKRSEMKIKELIESHSTDQAKISELTLQRSQLHADLAKMRTELYDNSKTKENVENLKKSLLDVENLIEYKNKRLFKQMKQLNFGLGSLQGIMSSSDSPRSEHCQHLFEKLQEIMGNILNISGCTDIEELNSLQESNGFNTMAKFREAMSEYEHENTELKDHIIYLDNLLQKEELKNKENKELLPQYRESIEKLRKNVHKIKDQLKETQQQRKEEKRQYLERLQEIEDINKELVEDNETLKGVNKELIEENETLKAVNEELVDKAKDNEMLILQNEEKLKKLMKDYKKLETSIKSVQKNQASSSAYSSVNIRRPTYEDNSTHNVQKDPRSRSRDHHTLNRTFTEGGDNLPKNVVPRSSSVARSRRETSSSNRRDVRGYQRQNTTDTATDQMSYGGQTVSSRRVRDLNSLNRTFEAEDRSHQTEDRNNYLQAPPTGKFRGNYDSAPPCYIEDNSIIEEKDSRDVALEENYYSGQVNRSYTRHPRNTSNYERAPKDLSLTTSFNGDLKHEIASLDNEIGEIQRFMEDNLDLDDTN